MNGSTERRWFQQNDDAILLRLSRGTEISGHHRPHPAAGIALFGMPQVDCERQGGFFEQPVGDHQFFEAFDLFALKGAKVHLFNVGVLVVFFLEIPLGLAFQSSTRDPSNDQLGNSGYRLDKIAQGVLDQGHKRFVVCSMGR
ncbi:hypothetical protein [Roseobacter fucihabitans]|uniref:hypothetical protein n=1 Tax=Roseobacter fucihabitans TaxID=1537242 RepID=UPI001CA367A7|nr:hypothetical protein [Roseobacter litoralis]